MKAGRIWETLAATIAATGTDAHVDRLIDLICADTPHDLVTVTRYSATRRPEFLKHRQYSDRMVRRYLERYYVYDPFYAYWRRNQHPGIVPLHSLTSDAVKRGRYISEFLAQSYIRDEVGILLADGSDWCLAIFLEQTGRRFTDNEITRLEERFPVFETLHDLDIRARGGDFMRGEAPSGPGTAPSNEPTLPDTLWPELTARERELVELILAGHPTKTIAATLGITVGTVKNHRRRIYTKLDITAERELFLEFLQQASG